MIINRLSVLLAERNVRANRLAVETGIAPSTLTRINTVSYTHLDVYKRQVQVNLVLYYIIHTLL